MQTFDKVLVGCMKTWTMLADRLSCLDRCTCVKQPDDLHTGSSVGLLTHLGSVLGWQRWYVMDAEGKSATAGRKLLNHKDNHGNVHAKQSQSQSSTNNAVGNNGPVNQQSNNQAIQQAGNGNSASNSNGQKPKGYAGSKPAGWYYSDNSGDVDADQSQSQSSTNNAVGNNGPVNQQSNNQAIQQAGNGNSASNSNNQSGEVTEELLPLLRLLVMYC